MNKILPHGLINPRVYPKREKKYWVYVVYFFFLFIYFFILYWSIVDWGFPGGSVSKDSARDFHPLEKCKSLLCSLSF